MTNNDNKDLNIEAITEKLVSLSSKEFMDLGFGGLSYIKPLGDHDGHDLFALHGADGSHIATGQDVAALQAIAKQNNLIPMSAQ